MTEEKNKQFSDKVKLNISLGVIVALIAALITNERRISHLEGDLTALKASTEVHIHNPSLHHNLAVRLERNYVTRNELDSRFNNIESELAGIERKLDRIAEHLNVK